MGRGLFAVREEWMADDANSILEPLDNTTLRRFWEEFKRQMVLVSLGVLLEQV